MYSVLHSSLIHCNSSATCVVNYFTDTYVTSEAQGDPHGGGALLPCSLVPDDEHRLTGRCIQGEGLLSVSLSL